MSTEFSVDSTSFFTITAQTVKVTDDSDYPTHASATTSVSNDRC